MSGVNRVKALSGDELEQLWKDVGSVKQMLVRLSISTSDARSRSLIVSRLGERGIDVSGVRHRRPPANLSAVVQRAICWTDALKELGLAPYGGNIATIKRWCTEQGISIDHFDATRAFSRRSSHVDICDGLVENTPRHRSTIRRYIKREQLIEYRCAICGMHEWLGKQLNLQLDHISGDPTDARVENLRWLCPNCHSQTDTWGKRRRET